MLMTPSACVCADATLSDSEDVPGGAVDACATEGYAFGRETVVAALKAIREVRAAGGQTDGGGRLSVCKEVDMEAGGSTCRIVVVDVQGKMVLVVDDKDRENEGDLIMAAEKATTESIAFIVRHSSGVICVAMEGDDLDRLQLPPMVVNNEVRRPTSTHLP